MTTDAGGNAEVKNLYLGNYYVKEITPSEGYLLDEEEHDVVCDYEGDLVAEVSRSTTSPEQVIKQPFQRHTGHRLRPPVLRLPAELPLLFPYPLCRYGFLRLSCHLRMCV